jgi:hypothetical protein
MNSHATIPQPNLSETDLKAKLKCLRALSMTLYNAYTMEKISLQHYIDAMRPVDNAIDILEMSMINCSLRGTLLFERSYEAPLR